MCAMDLVERLRPLADLVEILEAADADFGHWDVTPMTDGTEHLPWFVFGPTADAFRAAVGRGGWIITGFDWMTWLQTDEGQAFRDDPDAVAEAKGEPKRETWKRPPSGVGRASDR